MGPVCFRPASLEVRIFAGLPFVRVRALLSWPLLSWPLLS